MDTKTTTLTKNASDSLDVFDSLAFGVIVSFRLRNATADSPKPSAEAVVLIVIAQPRP
jgi:hypothetical protein